jgi:RNA polymerase sigma factor (sigma-70 family)
MTSEAIVTGIQAGDESAAEELYKIFDLRMARGALYGDLRDAEDSIHDAYILVLQALRQGRLREPKHLRTYAWLTLRNVMLTRRRGLEAHAIKVQIDSLPDCFLRADAPDPERLLMDAERCRDLRRRIDRLSPGKQIVVRMTMAGYRDKEIMAHTRWTLSTVKLRRFRAVRTMTANFTPF